MFGSIMDIFTYLFYVAKTSDTSLMQLIASLSAAQNIGETKSKYFHF